MSSVKIEKDMKYGSRCDKWELDRLLSQSLTFENDFGETGSKLLQGGTTEPCTTQKCSFSVYHTCFLEEIWYDYRFDSH